MITCVDEVGFGSRNENLRRYGNFILMILKLIAYAPIGKPAILEVGKKLSHNMTFTVSLSPNGVEFIQAFTSGGTSNETFEIYYEKLVNRL